MTAAINGTAPAEAPVVTETPETPEVVAQEAPVEAAKPDIIGADPAEATTPQLDADGRMRGPDGKFIAAEPKADGEKPAEAAKPVEAAKPEVPKVIDPINDPIPENAKPATRERITTLVETVKAKDAEVAAVRDDFEMVMAPIRESGATPDQFRESMTLLKLLNSQNLSDQQQALKYLQSVGAELAQRLGVVPPGADPLQGFEDLQLEVGKNPSLRKWAEEVANSRRLRDATQRHQEVQTQRSQQTQAQQREAQAGQAQVRAVEATLEATDPNYKAKVAALRSDAGFVARLKSMPPSQWAGAFAEGYRNVKIAAPAAKPAAAASPAPLRAKQPAGQTTRPAASSLEAVSAAIRGV